MTFDIEDYFQVGAFSDRVEQQHWAGFDSRVEANTDKILQILCDTPQKATFFTLGWVAEKYPAIVRKIVEQGHEIACHSYAHRRVYEMTAEDFRADTLKAKNLLEAAGGVPVKGYRAPSFSLDHRCFWAFDILAELGFTFDSSLFPVDHPNYGMPQIPRNPFLIRTRAGCMVEFPMPTLTWAGFRSPFGGGAYLRLLPYPYTRWAIEFLNTQENKAVCVYVHPWELDPAQPRIRGSLTARMRHYFGLPGMERKVRRLLTDFEFDALGSMLPPEKDLADFIDITRIG